MSERGATPASSHLAPIRTEAHEGDRAAVARLAESTGFFRADEIAVAVELVEDRLRHGAASGYEFVLVDDISGNLVGFANFGPIACTLGSFDLYWIVVAPNRQGKGVGRTLLAEAERRARAMGARRMYIETSSLVKYEPTRRFYTRAGYMLEARLAEFYAPGDDKLIFARSLD